MCLVGCAGAATVPVVPATTSDAGAADAGALDLDASVDAAADADADADAGDADATALTAASPCPDDMVAIVRMHAQVKIVFCIDRYEAAVVEVDADGEEQVFPHYLPVDGHDVRAVSRKGEIPQSYVSAADAEDACAAAGKRLCKQDEWRQACKGTSDTLYPYGRTREVGKCNDNGRSPVGVVFHPKAPLATAASATPAHGAHGAKGTPKGSKKGGKTKTPKTAKTPKKPRGKAGAKPGSSATAAPVKAPPKKTRKKPRGAPPGVDLSAWTKLNDPALGQVSGSWTTSGERDSCTTDEGVFDMVGNRHEWVSDVTPSGNGVFLGGYFLDVQQNGEGCNYRTDAHARTYHDYSTGFRCCKDAAP